MIQPNALAPLAEPLDTSPATALPASVAAAEVSAAQLTQLQRQLDDCRTELQEFTYTVSHDLRAPLRHINAFAQIIEEDWPDMPLEMAGHLATIRQSAQLLTQQLDGLTALSRLGQQLPQLAVVNTSALVQGVVDDLARQLPQRRIVWQLAPDLPQVWADAAMLQQVLTLLLDNTCKFTRPRAVAQISVRGALLADGSGTLTIADNGVGFQPGQASQLFKVFARLHPAREFDGLGLGLVTCRKLLERMGGGISISGAPDAGCEISLSLPMAPAV